MDIATLLFTYNRPCHTEKVLNALKANEIKPSKLIIFQDGLKESTNICDWEAVGEIIKQIDWCDVELHISSVNKGLAASIIKGVTDAFDRYEAVIVLEDDCVPHPKFMSYMISGLTKYVEKEQVYSVGGSAWPVEVQENGTDAYFTERINSCGWGTWKNRWAQYERDYQMLAEIKKDEDLSARFHIWGEDLESHLLGNIKGTCNSWAVFWALTVIKKKGYCLAPYQSLIENIGFDGSGVHCGIRKEEQNLRKWDDCRDMDLPDIVEFPDGYETNFSEYFSWVSPETKLACYNNIMVNWLQLMREGVYISEELLKRGIYNVSIWGKGKLCNFLLLEFKDRVKVLSIIESHPSSDEYQGIKIVDETTVPEETQMIIVIPVYDLKKIIRKTDNLWQYKIVGIDWLIRGGLLSKKFGISAKLFGANEIIRCGNQYGGFDVVADSSLRSRRILVYSFGIGEDLSFSQTVLEEFQAEVYAFDPTPRAIEYVKRSDLYRDDRFRFYAYALAAEDGMEDFYLPINESNVSGSLIQRSALKEVGISVIKRKLKTIIKELGHEKVDILKMDIEGAEFEVIHDITCDGIEFNQLCIEVHDRFFENGDKRLKDLMKELHGRGYVLASADSKLQEFTFIKS